MSMMHAIQSSQINQEERKQERLRNKYNKNSIQTEFSIGSKSDTEISEGRKGKKTK